MDSYIEFSCSLEERGRQCHYRHLVFCHPERIALLYLHGRLSDEEAALWNLTPCEEGDVNPFSKPNEKLCFDFENSSLCKRNHEGKICRFRHLLRNYVSNNRDRRSNIERRAQLRNKY